jgi:hypothetical protein
MITGLLGSGAMRPTTAALLAAATVLVATAAGPGAAGAADEGSSGTLVFTRDDGSTFTIRADELRIRCELLDTKKPVRGITVFGPESAVDYEKERIRAPFVDIEAVLADVEHGLDQEVPTANSYTGKGANVFVGDPGPDGQRTPPNELQSDQEESSGSMFVRGRCGGAPRLEMRIGATIGSEFHDAPAIRVRGSIDVRG